MKKVLIASVLGLCLATSAMAQHRHYGHGGYHRHHGGWGWVAPAIGGAIVGAIVYDAYNRPVYAQPPVVTHMPYGYPTPGNPYYPQVQPSRYECTETLRYSSVPGNEHIVRTCFPRYD